MSLKAAGAIQQRDIHSNVTGQVVERAFRLGRHKLVSSIAFLASSYLSCDGIGVAVSLVTPRLLFAGSP